MTRKILIVDDEYSFAEFAKMLVESFGYEAIVSLDAAKAIDTAVQEKPDVILMDLVLPGMDGTTAIQRLKADPRTAKIPIILCSITKARHEVQDAMDSGAEAFLPKPLSAEALKRSIGSALERGPR